MIRILIGLLLLSISGVSAQTADTAPPVIVIGLAHPNNMTLILHLPAGNKVTPDARGRVLFRAEIADAGSGVKNATMAVGNASASMILSPSRMVWIGAGWDTRKVASGTKAEVVVTATDAKGNRRTAVVTVTLKK